MSWVDKDRYDRVHRQKATVSLVAGQCAHVWSKPVIHKRSKLTQREYEYVRCKFCQTMRALNPTRKSPEDIHTLALRFLDDYNSGMTCRASAKLRGCSKGTVLRAFQCLDKINKAHGRPTRQRSDVIWWKLKIAALEAENKKLKELLKACV